MKSRDIRRSTAGVIQIFENFNQEIILPIDWTDVSNRIHFDSNRFAKYPMLVFRTVSPDAKLQYRSLSTLPYETCLDAKSVANAI